MKRVQKNYGPIVGVGFPGNYHFPTRKLGSRKLGAFRGSSHALDQRHQNGVGSQEEAGQQAGSNQQKT